jgi:hypothetical protein
MAAAFFLLVAERVASLSPFQVNITANKNEGKSRRKLLLFIFPLFYSSLFTDLYYFGSAEGTHVRKNSN